MLVEYTALLPALCLVAETVEGSQGLHGSKKFSKCSQLGFHAHCSSLSSKYKLERLGFFGSRLNASFPRGVVADLLLERFRKTEISRGRW